MVRVSHTTRKVAGSNLLQFYILVLLEGGRGEWKDLGSEDWSNVGIEGWMMGLRRDGWME